MDGGTSTPGAAAIPGSAFPRRARLRRGAEFKAVYDGRRRYRVGPLLVWSAPNGLEHCRLGLAVGRRAGGAVARNRIKRCLRNAFRREQAGWPGRYDVIVAADRHEPLPADEYRRLLSKAVGRLHERWCRGGHAVREPGHTRSRPRDDTAPAGET